MSRTYSDKSEHKFTFGSQDQANKVPTIQSLKQFVRGVHGLADGEHIDLCKYIPWQFEWNHLDPNQMVEVKKGKKNKKKELVKAGTTDLRNFPHFLADGDIIGVKFGKDDPQGSDDLQTDQDLINKSEFAMLKEEQRKAAQEAKRRQNTKKANDEHSLYIDLN